MLRPVKEYQRLLWDHENNAANLYQPIPHPAFSNWTCSQPCIERFGMIMAALEQLGVDPSAHGEGPRPTMLDIGCHTGWFCRAFGEMGWQIVGIDKDPVMIEVASELLEPWNNGPSFRYIAGDVRRIVFPKVDAALCLSTIMYLFPNETDPNADPESAWTVLEWIGKSSPLLFMDWGGKYSAGVPETFVGDMLERTDYRKTKRLGVSRMGRELWLFH